MSRSRALDFGALNLNPFAFVNSSASRTSMILRLRSTRFQRSARTSPNHPRLAVPRPSLANEDFRYEPRRYRDYRDLRGFRAGRE